MLEQAAQNAASGLAAPRLHPGQAWFTSELGMIASQWEPVTRGEGPPETAVLPTSRAVAEMRYRSDGWWFYDGDGRFRGGQVGRARFFGSAAEHARWVAEGSMPRLIAANGGGVLTSHGFTVGTRTLSYEQVLHFPTDPAAVLKFLAAAEPGVGDTFDTITNLLVQVPLRPAARAAVFSVLAKLPGVHYLGPVRDPLGRSGVAVALDRTVTGHVVAASGEEATPVTHLRSELIFNPQTAGLLAQETLLLNPPPLPGVRPPFPTDWIAYLASRVVPRSSAPTLKQLGVQPPPPQASPARRPTTP